MSDIEKIKERIAKLLAMSKDSASPEEAAIAATRARALMDKHQLDEFDIGNSIKEEFEQMNATRYYAAMPLYMQMLAAAVAKYNDTQAIGAGGPVFQKKPQGAIDIKAGIAIQFRGYKSDVELSVSMYNRLLDAINADCKEYMVSRGIMTYNVGLGTDFKQSAVNVLCSRLRMMSIERDQIHMTAANSGALVLAKKSGVEEKYGEVEYKEVNATRASYDPQSAEAQMYGDMKGRSIEIVKSIEHGEENGNGKEKTGLLGHTGSAE